MEEKEKQMEYNGDVKNIIKEREQGDKFLDYVKQRKIPVVIDGIECPYENSDYICQVFEDNNYMSDFMVNENGFIGQVYLDKLEK